MDLWHQKKGRSLLAPLLIALLVLSAGALLYSALDYQKRLDALRVASSDNRVWIMAQLEVDHLNLQIAAMAALDAARADDGSADKALASLRGVFDIFYSRVNIARAALQRSDVSEELHRKMQVLIDRRAQVADIIDAIPGPEPDRLDSVLTEVAALRSMVRDISTDTLQHFVKAEDTAWRSERALLGRIHAQSLLLLGVTLAAAALAWRLGQVLRQRTQAAERAARTLSKAFEASRSGVILSDGRGRIQQANPLAETILGCAQGELMGRNLREFVEPFNSQRCSDCFDGKRLPCEQCVDRRTGPRRATLRRPDGEVRQVEMARTGDRDANDRPVTITFIRDISEQVAAEAELRAARDDAQHHAKAKSMFLATMSHEMRTPLHGLIAALDLVADQEMGADHRELLRIARDCSHRVRTQIDDVLEFTRLGESQETPAAFRPVRAVQDVLNEISMLARERENKLSLIIEGKGAERAYHGLPLTFSRAVYNLAGNAVKFTQGGKVDVTLRFTPVGDGDTLLEVRVADTGIGIDRADQDRIFEMFETIANAELNASTGSGLGLPIVRLAVERMGGRLVLQSTPGEGSVFSFAIPLSPAQQRAAVPVEIKSPAPTAPRAAAVLVADDNEVNRTLLCEMLRRIGHVPQAAANGKEAVEAAATRRFDVILMDVSMPVMDGAEATKGIRAAGPSRDCLILGVTAYVDAERTAALEAVGMNGVLAKPIGQGELARTLERWLGTRPPKLATEDATADAAALPPVQPLRMLAELVGWEKAEALIAETFTDAEDALQAMRLPGAPDKDAIARIHRAAGSSAVVGFSALSEALRLAERRGHDGVVQPDPDMLAKVSNALFAARKSMDAPPARQSS